MGSFNFTDFVTDLPVWTHSNSLQVAIICKPPKQISTENIHNINELYAPVTFPIIGHYNDYGGIVPNDAFKQENAFALSLLDEDLLNDDGHLQSQDVNKKGYILCITDHQVYMDAIISTNMANRPVRFGMFAQLYTYKEKLEQNIADYQTFHENLKPGQLVYTDRPVIIQPDIGFSSHSFANIEQQKRIFETLQNDEYNIIFTYLLNWSCFYAYLDSVSKPFKSVAYNNEYFEFDLLDIQNTIQNRQLQRLKDAEKAYADEDDDDDSLSDTLTFDQLLNELYTIESNDNSESTKAVRASIHQLRKQIEKNGLQ